MAGELPPPRWARHRVWELAVRSVRQVRTEAKVHFYIGEVVYRCGKPMDIKLVEPHPTLFNKEKHTFECSECGFPRTYTISLN